MNVTNTPIQKAAAMLPPTSVPMMRPTHFAKALYFINDKFHQGINHRMLERNKYAPWGRGAEGKAHPV